MLAFVVRLATRRFIGDYDHNKGPLIFLLAVTLFIKTLSAWICLQTTLHCIA